MYDKYGSSGVFTGLSVGEGTFTFKRNGSFIFSRIIYNSCIDNFINLLINC